MTGTRVSQSFSKSIRLSGLKIGRLLKLMRETASLMSTASSLQEASSAERKGNRVVEINFKSVSSSSLRILAFRSAASSSPLLSFPLLSRRALSACRSLIRSAFDFLLEMILVPRLELSIAAASAFVSCSDSESEEASSQDCKTWNSVSCISELSPSYKDSCIYFIRLATSGVGRRRDRKLAALLFVIYSVKFWLAGERGMAILNTIASLQSKICLLWRTERVHTPMSGWHFDLVGRSFVGEKAEYRYNSNHKAYKLCMPKGANERKS
jgi:hypothetical protein